MAHLPDITLGNRLSGIENGGLGSSELQTYAKDHLLPGVAGSLALLAIVVTFALVFFLWRLVHCCCPCCEEDKTRVNPYKELKRPWLIAQQVMLGLSALGGIALALAGIFLLPEDVTPGLNQVVDNAVGYAYTLTGGALNASYAIGAVGSSLASIQAVIDMDIKPAELTARIQSVGRYIDGFTDPQPMAAATSALDSMLRQATIPNVYVVKDKMDSADSALLPSAFNVSFITPGATQAWLLVYWQSPPPFSRLCSGCAGLPGSSDSSKHHGYTGCVQRVAVWPTKHVVRVALARCPLLAKFGIPTHANALVCRPFVRNCTQPILNLNCCQGAERSAECDANRTMASQFGNVSQRRFCHCHSAVLWLVEQ